MVLKGSLIEIKEKSQQITRKSESCNSEFLLQY